MAVRKNVAADPRIADNAGCIPSDRMDESQSIIFEAAVDEFHEVPIIFCADVTPENASMVVKALLLARMPSPKMLVAE